MRKTDGVGHSSNRFVDYDAGTGTAGTVIEADFMNDIQDELIGIQDDFSIAEAAGTNEYVLAAIKGIAIKLSKQVGELFYTDSYKAPAEFDEDDPESFFPAICLDTISTYTDISSTNWSDLVTHLRAKKFAYLDGTGSEDDTFDVTGWDITSNVATLTFANTTAENAMLAALLEDKLVHGSYTNWRSITLAAAIGDIDADEYAITEVDTASRTVKFAFTAADNSGSGTFTVNFYQHRVPGSTTTARLFETKGRTLVSGNDSDGDCIIGMRRRDRFQGHEHELPTAYNDTLSSSHFPTGITTETYSDYWPTTDIITDGTNGTPRTGKTTDPRALIGHLYCWGRSYVSS